VAYSIRFAPAALKALESLDREAQRRIVAKLEALASNPRPSNIKVLKGGDDSIYRLRVGDYRVLYTIDDEELVVLVVAVGHRRDVYRR
jgi:mRNA interferase RelE/StbE